MVIVLILVHVRLLVLVRILVPFLALLFILADAIVLTLIKHKVSPPAPPPSGKTQKRPTSLSLSLGRNDKTIC